MACVGNGVGCVAGETEAGAVVQSLQTNGRILAGIMRLQTTQVILFGVLGCSQRVRADADTPATVLLMMQL